MSEAIPQGPPSFSADSPATASGPARSVSSSVRSLEIDTRLLGMIITLIVLWLVFNVATNGLFLSARNLWNLSVQHLTIAVMATGMVLIIVSRNIDLSVGSVVDVVGMCMALLQARWIPTNLGLGFDQPYTWIVSVLMGLGIGA